MYYFFRFLEISSLVKSSHYTMEQGEIHYYLMHTLHHQAQDTMAPLLMEALILNIDNGQALAGRPPNYTFWLSGGGADATRAAV